MNKNLKLVLILIVLVIIGLFANTLRTPRSTPQPEETATTTPSGKDAMLPYVNTTYGIAFEYPSSLLGTEREFGATSSPQFAIVLVKDTQENRDLLSGSTTVAREGPTSITIEVFANPENLSANDFAVARTNEALAQGFLGATSTVMVAGNEGVSYTWSGLYEGRSVVVTKGSRAYVFSVTWMTPEDQLIKDFDMILNSANLI